jgi:hypothetical protein
VPTIHLMETNTQSSLQQADFLHPLSGWEAAARWNQATFDWMARSFQQWLVLMTTLPPHLLARSSSSSQPDAQGQPAAAQATSAQPDSSPARAAHATAHASGKREPEPRRQRSEARPTARTEGRSSTRAKAPPSKKKARTRG